MSKRVLILSDTHCGSLVGLTPPEWQFKVAGRDRWRRQIARAQNIYWKFFISNVRKYAPYDAVILNGDAIDGKDPKGEGTELIVSDRNEQAKMCVAVLKMVQSRHTKFILTYGTAYHCGTGEDFEDAIAHQMDAKIGAHEWVDVEGVVFDCKHHVGTSAIPHGRHTAVAREHLWSQLWSEAGQSPKADVIVRSHIHYFDYCGGKDWLAVTTPALQGLGTKHGSRRCSGLVDFGFLVFDVSKGNYTWHAELLELARVKSHAIKIG